MWYFVIKIVVVGGVEYDRCRGTGTRSVQAEMSWRIWGRYLGVGEKCDFCGLKKRSCCNIYGGEIYILGIIIEIEIRISNGRRIR